MSAPAPLPGDLGTLYLMPNTLDFGADEPLPSLTDVLPLGVIERAAALRHWVAENAKTTRAFLKRVDAVAPLGCPLQAIDLVELPRPAKGRTSAGFDPAPTHEKMLAPILRGADVGLISEAGLPAVADPGSLLVAAAHRLGVRVVALPGPSALLLALAASGLHGQSFAFVGYVPVEPVARRTRIRELEADSRRLGQTQLMIETPYRNGALLAALIADLQPTTRLAVSCGITLAQGSTWAATVSQWRDKRRPLANDLPAVFALLA